MELGRVRRGRLRSRGRPAAATSPGCSPGCARSDAATTAGPRALPDIPARRVSGYNLDQLLPGRALNVARLLVGNRVDLRGRHRGQPPPDRLAGAPPPRRARLRRHLRRRARRAGAAAAPAARAGGLRRDSDRPDGRATGCTPSTCTCCRRRWRLAAGRGRRRQRGAGRRRWPTPLMAALPAGRVGDRYDDADGAGAGLAAPRVGPRRHRAACRRWRTTRGLGGRRGGAAAARPTTCAASRPCGAEFGYSGAWYGHFGQGCVHTRNNFDLTTRDGLATYRSLRRARRRPRRVAGRVAVRRARRRAGPRRAAGADVRAASWSRPSGSSRPSSTRAAG